MTPAQRQEKVHQLQLKLGFRDMQDYAWRWINSNPRRLEAFLAHLDTIAESKEDDRASRLLGMVFHDA